MQYVVNTYKQILDQTLNNAWNNDAYICRKPLANDMEV